MKNKLNNQILLSLGFNKGKEIALIMSLVSRYRKEVEVQAIVEELTQIKTDPETFLMDPVWSKLAEMLMPEKEVKREVILPKEMAAPFADIGGIDVEPAARDQMYQAFKLPISVRGALMSDAHLGYGLPIGGVLAVENEIIPYGVGVDIGCRIKHSVYDMPARYFKGRENHMLDILKANTKFGHECGRRLCGSLSRRYPQPIFQSHRWPCHLSCR